MSIKKTSSVMALALALSLVGINSRCLNPISKTGKNVASLSKMPKVDSELWFIESFSLSMSLHTTPADDLTSLHISLPAESIKPPNSPATPDEGHSLTWVSLAPMTKDGDEAGILDGTDTLYPSKPSFVPGNENECILKESKDMAISHTVLRYFYRIEMLKFNTSTLEEIEHLLLEIACTLTKSDWEVRQRMEDKKIIAFDSAPKDVLSTEYTCSPRNAEAQSCTIINGGMKIIIEGESDRDNDVLPLLFTKLAIDDKNVVDVEYLGDAVADEAIGRYINAKNGDKTSADKVFPVTMIIASGMLIGGALGTISVLVLGKTNGPQSSGIIGEDDSLALENIAETALSSKAQPKPNEVTHSTLTDHWLNPFIIAEEEESAWQSLGILPRMKRGLECIREEISSDDELFEERSI